MQILILAGGSGTRFWPASVRRRPKQLLALEGDRTLLQATVDRVAPLAGAERIWICTGRHLAAEVARQVPEVPAAQILSEPSGRNTLPAIAWSIGSMPPAQRDDVVVVLPADHRIGDAAAFRDALSTAVEAAAAADRVLALGVTPRWPETGYGYLELADTEADDRGLRRVQRFTEKPDAQTAASFVESGRYLWNAGIFVFRGGRLLDLVARFEPEVARGLQAIDADPGSLTELYPRLPSVSIDYGLMERLDDLATLPLDCGWSDLGSWQALAEILPHDEAGNAGRGDVVAVDARDNLLFAEEGQIAVLGVSGLVVVRTGQSVLVMPKERSQDLRNIVAALEAAGRTDLL